jgi:hypothetical protein
MAALIGSCRKDQAETSRPNDDDLIGLDVGSSSGKKRNRPKVSVGCIQDPADPACAEVLGAKPSGDGEVEFVGDTCRVNLCNGRGDCDVDSDGFVACLCDEGVAGEACDERER